MFSRTVVLLGLFAAVTGPALAAEAREVVETEEGSYEQALRESLLLMKAGDKATWMSKWCTPKRCETVAQRKELEDYMLKQAVKSSSQCLYGDNDAVRITSVKGDPETDERLSVRLECAHTKYPPPAVLEKAEGKWYVSSIPW